jgi:hypothetical protein
MSNSTTTCPSCGAAMEGGFGRRCEKCGAVASLNWQPWMGLIQVVGAVGFMVVLRFPWQVTIIITALVAANALLRRNSAGTPLNREGIAEQERNATHPAVLRMANFGVALSGALFVVSFMFAFVMFMNAREQWHRESQGNYRASYFRVQQSHWEKGKPGRMRGGNSSRASARGVVEGNEEWMDLQPYLGFTPKDEESVERAVPPGTVIAVYYDPELKGDYRVRFRGDTLPGVASHDAMAVVAKYGVGALVVTGLLLLGFLRLRRFSLGSA